MRKPDLVKVGEELYEIVQRFPVYKFSTEITGGKADLLKQFYGAEKILRNSQTNEYLFVNLVPELQIMTNDEQTKSSEKSKEDAKAEP
jgi:hypothetical protein